MPVAKTKKPVRKVVKSGNSPAPSGPIIMQNTCGHSHCDRACKVRYCGPTTSLTDHHAFHAARGVMHVWTASIVAGLAIVLTGTIAYTAAEAKPLRPTIGQALEEVHALTVRTQALEQLLKEVGAQCGGIQKLPPVEGMAPAVKPEDGQKTCIDQCKQATESCQKKAGDKLDMRQGCVKADKVCRVSCVESVAQPSTSSTSQI